MSFRAPVLLLCIAALAVPLGGCGDDGDGGTTTVTTSSLSKAEFLRRAGVICSRNRSEVIVRIARSMSAEAGSGRPEVARFTTALKTILLPQIEAELERVQALGAPAGDEAEVEAFLGAEREAVEEVAELPRIASRFAMERHFADAAAIAWPYGLGPCANAPEPTQKES